MVPKQQLEVKPSPKSKKSVWLLLGLIGLLILFDLGIHPLGAGPDRLLHDPAVYRYWDSNYLPGDWYTELAIKSGVYPFYAKLVNLWHFLGVSEGLWRQLLFLACLAVLFYASIRLARLFSKAWLVVPLMVLLHYYLLTGVNQPVWLYGPFAQIDGGLAPRSVGVALSILALFFFAKKGSLTIPALILGLATLIHVSNSLIVFVLFGLIWLVHTLTVSRPLTRQKIVVLVRQGATALALYLIAGGWFAIRVGLQNSGAPVDFPPEKFIWSWIYFRAPYMALPLAGDYWWLRLTAHVVVLVAGWIWLRRVFDRNRGRAIDRLGMIGLGSVGFFFLFYLFAFVTPWLPGFQFYSLRVIYLLYFVAYLFLALLIVRLAQLGWAQVLGGAKHGSRRYLGAVIVAGGLTLLVAVGSPHGQALAKRLSANLRLSAWHLLDNTARFNHLVPPEGRQRLPASQVFQNLWQNPEPVLAPPNWNTTAYYLPRIVSFKSFGFTEAGLPEWLGRINAVTGGELERLYQSQRLEGRFKPVALDWVKLYADLTAGEVMALAEKYRFELFLTYRGLSYPFEELAADEDFRLYRLPSPRAPEAQAVVE